jgi:hypothetical protein
MKTILAVLSFFTIINCSFAGWEHMTNGLFANGITYGYANFNNTLVTSMGYGRFYSTDNGVSWNWTDFNIRYDFAIGANDTRMFVGNGQSGVWYSTNPGTNWIQTSFNSGLIRCMEVLGNSIFVGFDGGVKISRDNGETWEQTLGGNVIYSIKINDNTNTIFAATLGNGVLKSTDKGFTWVPTGLTGINVFALTVQNNRIFAGMNYGVLVSEDNGDTWTYTSHMIETRMLTSNEDFVFAGGFHTGVYVSSNSGSNWVQRNDGGIGNYTIYSLFIHNGYIFIGTEGNGAYRRELDELLGVQIVNSEIPVKYSLSQNYPNPFNPETNIRFEIPANSSGTSSNVKLVIFDVLGKEVATLTNELLKPGTYEVNWNASANSSGVYYYMLKTDNFVETKKMMLVK